MKRSFGILSLLTLSSSMVFSGAIVSENSTLFSPVGFASGSATNANTLSLDHALFNPSSASFFPEQLKSMFFFNQQSNAFGAALVDTRTKPFNGTMFYIKRDIDGLDPSSDNPLLGNVERKETLMGGGLMARASNSLSFGATVKYLTFEEIGRRKTVRGKQKIWNFDINMTVKFPSYITAAIVYQNIMKDEYGINPQKIISSMRLDYKMFTASVEIEKYMSKNNKAYQVPNIDADFLWRAGGSYRFYEKWRIMGAYQDNTYFDLQSYSLGLAMDFKKITLDYGFEKAINQNKYSNHVVTIGALF